jgi:hypothetical protein
MDFKNQLRDIQADERILREIRILMVELMKVEERGGKIL